MLKRYDRLGYMIEDMYNRLGYDRVKLKITLYTHTNLLATYIT